MLKIGSKGESMNSNNDNLTGLSSSEVLKRKNKGLVNYDTSLPTKSINQIIFGNLFTLFNFLNIVLALAIVLVKSYKNLLFMGVVFCNTIISIIQEIHAKKTIDKLSVISSTKVNCLRDGKVSQINIDEIVLDDILVLTPGNQVIVDGTILKGKVEVNESFITGEEETLFKEEEETLLSGSFIVSGKCFLKVIHIGNDNYTSKISSDAKYIKKANSVIMSSLNSVIKWISFIILPLGICLFIRQFNIPDNDITNATINTVAALIGMIPEGLILLTSTVMAVSVIRLSKYKVLTQQLYSLETLARVDMICFDKTGTLTKGEMEVYSIIPSSYKTKDELKQIVSNIINNLDDNNPTFNALKNKYNKDNSYSVISKLPFSSTRKYSGVSFVEGNYLIGAAEFILGDKYSLINEQIKEYSKDYRVLIIASSDSVVGDKISNPKVLGYILLQDKIREEAKMTIKYFKEQYVDMLIISGDNIDTIETIAKRVGFRNPKAIDASALKGTDDINEAVSKYNLFGRVTPIQKKEIILALQRQGHVVAMTGDGVNDVLALKEADCGIAMASGSEAARSVSELVLLDSNFDAIPMVVKEGRRTINNIERSASLFLTKTSYSTLLALFFLIVALPYPFVPIQLTLTSIVTIGIPSFILALEPNDKKIYGNFLTNVISRAMPAAFTILFNIIIIIIVSYIFNISSEVTSTLSVIMTASTGFMLLYKISYPFNWLRTILYITMISFFLVGILGLRTLFSLTLINFKMLIIIAILMISSIIIFHNLSIFVEKMIEKHYKKRENR